MAEPADPFGTAAIRERVLAGWGASAARFREDANAEEDLVLGGYRDRLVVELAQNASDAAERAGVPGVLRLALIDGDDAGGQPILEAANTGAPLDAAGAGALATLRASAKRDGASVGRFGVGFAAVVAVSDEPMVLSTGGGIRFSRTGTLRAASMVPGLGEELRRRDGRVPVLRLPWPCADAPPPGFDTAVRLPLRPDAVPVVRAALEQVTAELLLALPGLARIEVGNRLLTRLEVGQDLLLREEIGPVVEVVRWRQACRAGQIPPPLLAERPVEERARPRWSVTCAVPVASDGTPRPLPGRQVVHAPTPSEEPLSLPVRLIATVPLEPTRRHVAPGALADFLAGQIAATYADLVASLRPVPAVLALVPRPGLVMAAVDSAVCQEIVRELRQRRWLPAVVPAGSLLAPGQACVVDGATAELVGLASDLVAGVLPAEWSGHAVAQPLELLGVRRITLPGLVELLRAVRRPPAWWRQLYQALERGAVAVTDPDALAAVPVPLTTGELVTGARGLLVPTDGVPVAALDQLGLRLVHPDAAHPWLERLGAVAATVREVLADPRVRAAVAASVEESEPEPIATAVLELVAAAGVGAGELPWLADLALPAATGQWLPAGELVLPDSQLALLVGADSPFGEVDREWVGRYGAAALRAVGVLDTFAVLREPEVDPVDADHDLDGEDGYYEAILDRFGDPELPPRLRELVAVRDLELVRAEAWPAAVRLLAASPLREVIAEPAELSVPGGARVTVPSYTRWWLSTHPVLEGRRPCQLRLPTAVELAGLYDEAPGDADTARLLGCLPGLDAVLADRELAVELLHRLGEADRKVEPVLLRTIYARLAQALAAEPPDFPDAVRVAPERVAGREACVVLDTPYRLPLLAGLRVVPAGGQPGAVADLLGVPFASDVVSGAVESHPVRVVGWPTVPGVELAVERCGAAVPGTTLAWHEELRVAGRPVSWWPEGEVDHVDLASGAAGLGRALAWRLDRWPLRAAVVEALAEPGSSGALRAEDGAA